MLLVADSGSTKADWLTYDGTSVQGPLHTMGFNPFFHDAETVVQALSASAEMNAIRDRVTAVKFFGAGCSSAVRNEIIASGLRTFFSKASVRVEHDLLACALATCGNEPGISCIIGTGSNSCWFDGTDVYERNYGLGYVLGDEGSGAHIGKKLLTAYLYGRMPEDISALFLATYALDKNAIIDKVYREPNANVWLAGFTRFLTTHYSHPWVKALIRECLNEFCDLYILDYADYRTVKVHFVGSVAFLFREELESLAREKGFSIGKIIKQPIEELMGYFVTKGLN